MRSLKGFTLIELMIVVAIIAILAAIAISQYQDYVIRSQVSEAASLAEGLKSAVTEFYNQNGRFPNAICTDANTSVGLPMPASIVGSYVSETAVAGEGCPPPMGSGTILTTFSSNEPFKANAGIDTASLLFSPITHAGSVSWRCKRFLLGGSVVIRDKWLPSSCR